MHQHGSYIYTTVAVQWNICVHCQRYITVMRRVCIYKYPYNTVDCSEFMWGICIDILVERHAWACVCTTMEFHCQNRIPLFPEYCYFWNCYLQNSGIQSFKNFSFLRMQSFWKYGIPDYSEFLEYRILKSSEMLNSQKYRDLEIPQIQNFVFLLFLKLLLFLLKYVTVPIISTVKCHFFHYSSLIPLC